MNKLCIGCCMVLASAMIMGMKSDIPYQQTVKVPREAVVQVSPETVKSHDTSQLSELVLLSEENLDLETWNAAYDAYIFKREAQEQKQQVMSSLTKVVLSSIAACLLLQAAFHNYSFI